MSSIIQWSCWLNPPRWNPTLESYNVLPCRIEKKYFTLDARGGSKEITSKYFNFGNMKSNAATFCKSDFLVFLLYYQKPHFH